MTTLEPQLTVSTSELLQLIPGVTKRNLDYWINNQHITPPPPQTGRGNHRQWNLHQTLKARALHRLTTGLHPIGRLHNWSRLINTATPDRLTNELTWLKGPVAIELDLTIGRQDPLRPWALQHLELD
jgi:hypothetical protein